MAERFRELYLIISLLVSFSKKVVNRLKEKNK